MGFGTLFIGYFFLINISYFAYTDIISAMVMLMGLYKLSGINKNFKSGMISAGVFVVFSLTELIFAIVELFASPSWLTAVLSYLGAARYLFIFILTLFIMRAISDVATEVEAYALAKNAKASVPLSIIFAIASIFEISAFAKVFGSYIAYIYFAILLAVVVSVLSNLLTIYKAYMQICMPEEEKKPPKKSRFEFMNKFYDSMEKSGREYAEYKIKKKQSKSKKGKK